MGSEHGSGAGNALGFSRRGFLRTLAAGSLLAAGPAAGDGETRSDHLRIENQNLGVRVDGTTGQVQVADAAGRSLLYPANTSGLTVLVDGGAYSNWCEMREFATDGPRVVEDGRAVRMEWRLPGADVRRDLRLQDRSLQFTVELRNRDERDHSIAVQYLLDYQVGGGGTTPVVVGGVAETGNVRFGNPSFGAWTAHDHYPDPRLTAHQTVDDAATSVEFLEWSAAERATRDGTAVGRYEGDGTERGDSPLSDTAALVTWQLGTLGPEETRTVSMRFGVGPPPTDAREPSSAVERADLNGDGEIDLRELSRAARMYADGEYTLRELAAVAEAYSGTA